MKHLLTLTLFIGIAWGQDWLDDLKNENVNEWLLKSENYTFAKEVKEQKYHNEIQEGVNLALWNFYGNNDLYNQLQNMLVEFNYNVIDRSVLELTIKEKNLSMSGIVVGKSDIFSVLNIDYVISGDANSGIFKLINVETGMIVSSINLSNYGPRKDNITRFTSFIILGLVTDIPFEKREMWNELVDRRLMNNDDYNSAVSKIIESNNQSQIIGNILLGSCGAYAIGYLILSSVNSN